jgi:hypothetical protein
MAKYTKRDITFAYAPYLPEENFMNTSGGTIQALQFRDILPYAFIKEDLPVILPQKTEEGVSGVGEGRNITTVLKSEYEVGAGSIPAVAMEFLPIFRLGGDITITHQTAQEWTVTAVAPGSITTGSYICFDVINSSGVHIKYMAWFDKDGDGSADKPTAMDCYDPVDDSDDGINQSTTGGKREFVQIDISSASDAQDVSDAIQTAINGTTDITAANGGGTSETVTCTNDQNGAVMDSFDYDSGLTIANTTRGRDKIEIDFDAATTKNMSNFGFHAERDNSSDDVLYDLVGCTIAEHTIRVESGEGVDATMVDEANYMICGFKDQYGGLTMLGKPRSPYGVAWTQDFSPFGNHFSNHGWETAVGNETLTYNSVAISAVWKGWSIKIENDLNHNNDGDPARFKDDVDFNKRTTTISITVQPEDHTLYELNHLDYADYAGDLLIQLKTINSDDSNIYLQFDCDKCILQPFDESIKADGAPEEYELELIPAPGATFGYTLQTYLPNYYFGWGGN